MKTILTADQVNDMFYESYFEKNAYTLDTGYKERHFSASLDACSGNFFDVWFEEVYIGYGELDLLKHTQINYKSPQEMVTMLFVLSGCIIMKHSGLSSEVVLQPGNHNLFYLNEEIGKKEWINSTNEPLKALEISFTTELFRRFVPEDSRNLSFFNSNINSSHSAALSSYQSLISSSMMHTIYDIIHCNKPAALRKLFFTSKAMELLMLQINQLLGDTNENLILKQNKDRMFEVKNFLESHLDPDFTIPSLAKAFGTNEYTLKKDFKYLFGKSIFDYWNGCRFDYAKQLLKEGYAVQQLSERLGYTNPQNFSTAFKRRFGVSPSFFK
ncbi:MAG: AraC family transcriptional regulator [Bacteroidota bacterium]